MPSARGSATRDLRRGVLQRHRLRNLHSPPWWDRPWPRRRRVGGVERLFLTHFEIQGNGWSIFRGFWKERSRDYETPTVDRSKRGGSGDT